MNKISSNEFVYTLNEIWNGSDRRICFVLGAGASKSSGIRTGGELAKQWLDEIEQRMDKLPEEFQKFLKEKKLTKTIPASNYPELYRERFRIDPETGFDFINREMEKARPGYGYSVLAQIMAEKQHNIVITTNFDNLTEEALYTYTSKRPLICGHESLAAFAKPSTKRPLIVKIHRDRYFNPQSNPDEVGVINKSWIGALNNIFISGTPVFIGYGGNDGSLMGYMENVTSLNNLFWCERKDSNISERVEKLLEKHNGKLVEIEGFDELMFLLQAKLNLKLLNEDIVTIAQERAKDYRETFERISKTQAQSTDENVQQAAARIVEDADENKWWSWELKANAAKTNDEKETIYKEALNRLPKSAELNGNYALFLHNIRKNYDEAEKYYKKALEFGPDDADYNGNYALFLHNIRKNYDEAEKYFKKALKIDPESANKIGNYAIFLHNIRKNYDEAEKYFKKALEIDPEGANNNGNYALFLHNIRKNYDEAEKYFKKALEIDPESANNNGNYALFLHNIMKNYDEAEKYFKKALEIDPESANKNGNYANFLNNIRKNYDEAEKYFKKALEIDPESANKNGNYALFLHNIRKNYDEAEKYYKKALEIDPESGNYNGGYAIFLRNIRKNYDEAEKYFKKALEIDPETANNNGNYAGFLFGLGSEEKALKHFSKAFTNCDDEDLLTELWFYKYAHIKDEREVAIKALKTLICEKQARSIGFNLQNNVDAAIKDGHPNPKLLQQIADIITNDTAADEFCKMNF